jgi:hypothetical protein
MRKPLVPFGFAAIMAITLAVAIVGCSKSDNSATTVPTSPTGVTATGGNNQVSLGWTAVSGATSYNIYWSTSSGVTTASGAKISS